MPSSVLTVVIVFLVLAGSGIGVSVVLSGANMVTAFMGQASVLVACSVVAFAVVIVAQLALALTLHAAVLRRLGRVPALALVLADSWRF